MAETLHAVASRYGVWQEIAKVAVDNDIPTTDLARIPVTISAALKRVLGKARWKTRRDTGEIYKYDIRLAAMIRSEREIMANTITHEAAHVIDVMLRSTSDHGPRWQRLHRAMGGDGKAVADDSHVVELSRAQRKTVATCSRCDTHLQRHKRLRNDGRVLRHRGCGGIFVPVPR